MRRRLGVAALSIAAVYALICGDLALRARAAYLEGERQLSWSREPSRKQRHFDALLAQREQSLAAAKTAGTMGDLEYAQRIALARLERDDAVAEDSLGVARRWYESAAELFSRPDNPWARAARQRLAELPEKPGASSK